MSGTKVQATSLAAEMFANAQFIFFERLRFFKQKACKTKEGAMGCSFVEYTDEDKKSALCKKVLDDLPLWFGIPEANREYCEKVRQYRFIGLVDNNREIGFFSIKQNNEFVFELYVLGILPQYHRKGYGKAAIEYICKDLRSRKAKYLEVKTLDESRESEEYQRTRLFYINQGFTPLDVLTEVWGERNPCLLMIKQL